MTSLMVGLKTYAKISPKMVKPRDIAGNAEEEEHPNTTYNEIQGMKGRKKNHVGTHLESIWFKPGIDTTDLYILTKRP